MNKRDAWLAAFTAVLGVSPLACKAKDQTGPDHPAGSREVSAVPDPSAFAPAVADAAPAASTLAFASASGTASAPPFASASARPAPTGSGGVVRFGSIRDLRAACGASTSCGASSRVSAAPTASVSTTVTGAVGDDERIVATKRPRLKSCANKGLASDPNMSGQATLSLTIDETGAVTESRVASSSGLDASTTACMASSLRSAQFAAGTKRTLTIVVRSVAQSGG